MTLALRGVVVTFGGVRALDGLSLEFDSGRIIGLVGPNGAGKTTALNVATGFTRVTAGKVTFGDRSRMPRSPDQFARLGVRRTFQTTRLLGDRSAMENVALGLAERHYHFWQAIRFPANRQWSALREEVMSSLESVGLADRADELTDRLSHGQRRLVEIARAMVAQPRFLLLDEPAAGLSPRETELMGELLISLVESRGCGVVLVEHNLGLVSQICSHLYVLDVGKLIASGQPRSVMREPVVARAYTGDS